MRRWMLLIAALAAVAGCGDDPATDGSEAPGGTRVVLRSSPFGDMLFDSRRQAIYVFQLDGPRRTACYGECARAWPPVLTDGKPVAGEGVDPRLLGTIERRGGARQVTYAGRPLYFYAHEGRGEVLCHKEPQRGVLVGHRAGRAAARVSGVEARGPR